MKKTIFALVVVAGMLMPADASQADAPIPLPPPPIVEVITQAEAIEYMKVVFADAPIMLLVAKAESRQCHPDHLVNPTSSARGCFQILKGTFADPAYQCSGDRMKHKDNIDCARKIYDRDGTRPWNASKHNWQQ